MSKYFYRFHSMKLLKEQFCILRNSGGVNKNFWFVDKTDVSLFYNNIYISYSHNPRLSVCLPVSLNMVCGKI